jgi:hypothetical protein
MLLACAFAGTVLVTRQATITAASVQPPALSQLPLSIDGWEGAEAAPLDPETAKIVAPDRYLHRFYVGETGEVMGTQAAAGDLIGAPLIDPAPKPFRVAFVTITREGVVEAWRPASLMFREEKAAPIGALPGRTLARERVE